jgi:repressor LexA
MPRVLDVKAKAEILRGFVKQNKRLPGYNEMLTLFGYRSKNAVHGLLRKFVEAGYLSKDGHKLAMTGRTSGGLRVLGTVQAGFPSPAEEELLGTLSLDEFLIGKPDATFILKVTGDSMVDAGILPGDLVLVERGTEPRDNDIIIAHVDGEWTMKYFVKDEHGVRLDPANSRYKSIRPARSLEIGGVVRSVIRKLP